MGAREWLSVGIKLIGVCVIVFGLVGFASMLVQVVMGDLLRDEDAFYVDEFGAERWGWLVQLVAQLAIGFVLVKKTEWCVRFIGYGEGERGGA